MSPPLLISLSFLFVVVAILFTPFWFGLLEWFWDKQKRARVVAFLRAADSECLVWFAAQRIEQGWHERFERVPNLDNGGE